MSVTKVTGMMSTGTKGGDIPSASTLVIDTDGDYFDITGTTGITAMTVDAGRRFTLQFDGAVTLTHGSSLYLPGATNFTTEANDCLSFIATAANTVRCTGYALKDGGSPVAASAGFTHGTEQATSSGTGVTFSGIPAGVSMIVVAWDDVTLDSASAISVQLGDAGGIETSGYDIIRGYWRASSTTLVGGGSAGFDLLINFSAGYGCAGQMILTLKDPANHTWVYTGMAQASSPSQVMGGAGDKSLSAELTQLKFMPLSGNFSAGSVNIMYQ